MPDPLASKRVGLLDRKLRAFARAQSDVGADFLLTKPPCPGLHILSPHVRLAGSVTKHVTEPTNGAQIAA
jgi:hypothetical protein